MKALQDQQKLFLVESEQLYQAWREVAWRQNDYKYGMRWKRVNGKDYLIRLINAKGDGRSLGVRSIETENTYAQFTEGKQLTDEKYRGLNERLKLQARLNKATRLGRLPSVIGEILLALDRIQVLPDFRVVGTHALYAYEAMGAVEFKTDLLASGDVDLLFDNRRSIALVAKKLDGHGLLGLLKKIDKTFEIKNLERFRAVNKDGFMVDMLTQDRGMNFKKPDMINVNDFDFVEIPNLEWLINSPRIEQVVVGANGVPVMMPVPDPRAFAIHKAWLSKQSDREPVKKSRDFNQAAVVIKLLQEHLPNYPMLSGFMKNFPKTIFESALSELMRKPYQNN
jgi:hypothetical protein